MIIENIEMLNNKKKKKRKLSSFSYLFSVSVFQFQMGKGISRVKYFRDFNLEERVFKYIEKDKKPSPRHPSTVKRFQEEESQLHTFFSGDLLSFENFDYFLILP